MANKPKRIEMLLRKNISDILTFELKDEKVGFVTVTDLKLSNDYQYARVYVTFLNATQPLKNLAELKKAKGFVRSSLAKKMDIWKIPQVEFLLDDSFEKAEQIEKVLNKEQESIEDIKKKLEELA